MKNIKIYCIALVLCVLSYFGGKYTNPPSATNKESEIVKEKKKTETTRTTDKKETTLPDGTKIVETVTRTERKTDSEKNKETSKETVVKSRPEWRTNLTYLTRIDKLEEKTFVADVQKRILGEIYLGVSASTQKQIGLSISIGF